MTSGISRLRHVGAALLAVLTAVVAVSSLGVVPASAAAGFSWTRYAGENRFDTAAKIAIGSFGTAQTVLLARADLFPDALAGNYLAGSVSGGAPVLLTRTDSLPPETNSALTTLAVQRVIILGGPQAVSPAVEAQLRDKNLQVERAAGDTRFDTAQRIAERPGPTNVGTVDGAKTAILASGRNFPDALAGGPLSYAGKLPTLLTEPTTLSPQARSAFTNLAIRQVLLLGGPAAVAPGVEDQVKAMGITVVRLAGDNRQHTATRIAAYALEKLAFNNAHANLARGDGFADALSGGPHSGKELSYILLSLSPTVLSIETRDFLNAQSSTLNSGHIFGGLAAISAAVEQEAATAAGSGRASITLTTTRAAQGGQVIGTVTGQNIQSVSVSGCGLTQQAVNTDANGQFTLQLPSSQGPGPCSFTFVTTFTDGSTETDVVPFTIDPIAKAVTAAPELLIVQFVRTVNSQTSVGSSTFEQSTFRFTFDEAIIGKNPDPAKFVLYRYDRVSTTAQPSTYRGQTAQIDPADSKSALVVFGGDPTKNLCGTSPAFCKPVGARQVAVVSTAGVDIDAVRDNGGQWNPEGAAPTRDVVFEPGRTTAPDLLEVGNFRPNFDSTRTLADFTFDQPAWVCVSNTATGPCTGNAAVQTPTVTPYRLILSTPDGGESPCFFVPAAFGVTTSGNGTTVHTVSCATLPGAVQLSASNVARGTIDPGAVAATADPPAQPGPSASDRNPLQAADVNAGGENTRPDLVSVEFREDVVTSPDATVVVDQVVYTFDEPVFLGPASTTTTPDATRQPPCSGSPGNPPTREGTANNDPGSCFLVYRSDGTEVPGLNRGPVTANDASPVRSTTDATKVIVNFTAGTLADATGASVRDGAVIEAVATGGVNRINQKDEVEAVARTIPGGRTNGPDLVACRTEGNSFDPVTGRPLDFRLVLTFDEQVNEQTGLQTTGRFNTLSSNIHVYDSTGQLVPQIAATRATRSTTNRNEVIVPANTYQGVSGGTAATLRNGVACGLGENVVFEATSGPVDFAGNPIGYQGLLQAPAG